MGVYVIAQEVASKSTDQRRPFWLASNFSLS
jgi:hypothetical protein